MSNNGSETKENFSEWVICGNGSDTFIGKPINRLEEDHDLKLHPCYKYETHMMQIPQTDHMGRVVNIGLAMQELVSTPTGMSKDVAITIHATWLMEMSKDVEENIARLVKIARTQQIAARSAAAGIQTAGVRL